jgi:tetratricopeptide (TPR) repeat protein
MGRSKRAFVTTFSVALIAAGALGCSSNPKPQDPPVLTADPPVGGAEGMSSGAVNTELQRAIQYIKNEKYDEAKSHLEAALAEKPDHAEANYYMGLTTEMLGDKKTAEGYYKKAISLDPALIEAFQNLAAMYLDEPARPDDAIPLLQKALEKAPDDSALLQNLGYAYGLKKDYPNASKAYEAALKKEDKPSVHFAYGALLFEANDLQKAAGELAKALDGVKKDAATSATIARMLGKAGAYADCVRALDQAIAIKSDPELLVRRGTCKHETKDEEGARADFEAATKADPKFATAYYYLGMSYSLEKKNRALAITNLEKASKLGEGTQIGKDAKEKMKELIKQKP